MAWFNFPVTQPFGLPYEPQYGGHSGVDIGTPNNTPLYLPYDGKVIQAEYKPWGGQIAVLTKQGMMVFLHTNEIDVAPGQQYHAGEVLGTSGGGVGDKLLGPGGSVMTATQQSDFGGYSTGYHTHFSVFNVTDINGINAALSGNVNRLNPENFVQSFITNKPIMTGTSTPNSTDQGAPAGPALNLDFASGLGAKIGIFLLALVMVIFGFYLLFQKQVNQAVGTAKDLAVDAVAPEAAAAKAVVSKPKGAASE
jgi:hypothetical protein